MRSQLLCVMVALAACSRAATTDPHGPVTNQPVATEKRVRPRLTLDGAMAMMPEDTELVVELDVARLRRSAVWERVEPSLRQLGGETLDEVARLCGFDPLGTLDTLLLGARGLGQASIDMTLLVRGYEQRASMACLEKASAAAQERGENKTARVEGDRIELFEGTTPSLVVRFVDPQTALIVSRAGSMVDRVALDEVAARKPGEGLTRSAAFQQLISRVNTRSTAWLALDGQTPLLASMPYPVKAIRAELHAGSDPARALVGTLVIELGDENNATSLAAMLRMALDTLKGGPYDDITQGLLITDEAGDVSVEVRLDLAQLERIGALFGPVFP